MALAPLHKCNTPGCNRLIRGQAHCDAHAKRARAKTTDRFYLSKQWRRARELHLSEFPLCAECELYGMVEPARVVDHIEERKDRPDLELEPSNFRSLCGSCHNRKTARERMRRKRSGGG